MASYILKINRRYIQDFRNTVRDGLLNLNVNSHSNYLRVILDEINRLFKIISGRLASRRDIPKQEDFPDSRSHNDLISNISIDLEKIYTAQEFINSDIQNVANFNSLERTKSVKNLSRVQQKVYSVYIKSKAAASSGTEIIENFEDDFLPEGSRNVEIDAKTLRLETKSRRQDRNNIDTQLVNVFFIDRPNRSLAIYPNNRALSLGSFWSRGPSDYHFILKDDKGRYMNMMKDGAQEDQLGTTQFEAVFTSNVSLRDGEDIRQAIESYLSSIFKINSTFIMMDKTNSLHGSYISDKEDIEINPKFKLVIPFTNPNLTNSILLNFGTNDSDDIPAIDINESFIFDESNRRRRFVVSTSEELEQAASLGEYKLIFEDPFVPSRMELVLYYQGTPWPSLSEYVMASYKFDARRTLGIRTDSGSQLSVAFIKLAYIFVDAESDRISESNRANKVMQLQGVK